ncbi:hypothetical protein ACHAPV_000302 [Trichoderma viride]
MAAIHDRYTVLPSQRLRRPGALLRTVLRHRDYAGDRHPHDRIQVTGQTAGQVTGQVLLPTIAGFEYHLGPSGAIGPESAAALQIQAPPTATAPAAAPAAALTAPTGVPSPSIPAGLAPGPPFLPPAPLRPSPNFYPLSIRHARSTSSPLPLHAAPPPASASTPASAPEKRRARLSSPIATMPEYRHMRSGSLSIPNGAHGSSSHHSMPRSPPNTSHVPCKFFRQGACQAGTACPFSHDLGSAAENICKYFAKGNCKFGPKCANIHVLPDGRRINYGKNGVTIGANPLNLANRAGGASPVSQTPGTVAGPFHHSSASALTNSLYRADQPAYPYLSDEMQQFGLSSSHHDSGLPTIDAPYSVTDSNYGSPPDDESSRLGFGLSPAAKGLSVLDAPLPASFDSNGISNAARFPAAPWPSSVPSKFGLESPSPSLSSIKDQRTSETLKLLHSSAFGSSEHLITPTASSPPDSHHLTGEEYFGKRIMHSTRYPKQPRMLSASMPKNMVDRDWEAEFAFGDDDNVPENLVPGDLQDLLTPAEKARRGSMRDERPDFSLGSLGKYGSPIGSSPSRWGPLFQRQKEEEEMTRSARSAAGSAFGHVGSPLRNSILAKEMSDNNGINRPSISRPVGGSESMSVLSQQLQRSRLDDTLNGSSPLLHPTAGRSAGNGISPIGKDRGLERHVSSASIGSSGRFTTPIDEEDSAFVFSMEEEEDSSSSKARKRGSSGLALGSFTSYASAAAASKGAASSNGAKDGRDAVPVNGR